MEVIKTNPKYIMYNGNLYQLVAENVPAVEEHSIHFDKYDPELYKELSKNNHVYDYQKAPGRISFEDLVDLEEKRNKEENIHFISDTFPESQALEKLEKKLNKEQNFINDWNKLRNYWDNKIKEIDK